MGAAREIVMAGEDENGAGEHPTRDEIASGLLVAYGNLVGVAAATATGLGVPGPVVRQMIERLDDMNRGSMASEAVAGLFSEELARVIAALGAE